MKDPITELNERMESLFYTEPPPQISEKQWKALCAECRKMNHRSLIKRIPSPDGRVLIMGQSQFHRIAKFYSKQRKQK